MVETNSLQHGCYLLQRALRVRGFTAYNINEENSFLASNAFGEFRLTFMPGNRRVLISSHVVVKATLRGKGIGRKMLNMREEIAREAGVNLLLATVREDNAIEIHLLETSGWKRYNQRETGVCLWGKEL